VGVSDCLVDSFVDCFVLDFTSVHPSSDILEQLWKKSVQGRRKIEG
jgi:hypothetical protein